MKIKNKYIPYIILILIGATLAIRSFYSFCWSDESFYLALAHRLWLGESIIIDEWYHSSVFAPLLLPIYSLYLLIRGNNEGVYLAFRLFYLIWSMGLAFGLYHLSSKHYPHAACLGAASIYLFYSRANIWGMSYYNMTLSFVLWGALLLYRERTTARRSCLQLIGAGILFGLAVICNPYLIVGEVAIAFAIFLLKRWHKERKNAVTVMGGSLIVFLIYMCCLLASMSISEIIQNLPYILGNDGLQKTSPLLAVVYLFGRVAFRFRYTVIFTCLITVFILAVRFVKKRELGRKQQNILIFINILVFLVNVFLSHNMVGCVNIALVLFAVPLLLLKRGERMPPDSLLVMLIGAGIWVISAFMFSSDTGLDAMTVGYVLIAAGMVLWLSQLSFPEKWFRHIIVAAVIIVGLQTAFLRFFSVYRDDEISKLNTRITSGPAKYLYTSAEHAAQYQEIYDAIRQYVSNEDTVIYTKECCWAYLCRETAYGTPYSWRIELDHPILEKYYAKYPEKIPTCVVVIRPEYGAFRSTWIQNNEYAPKPNENVAEGFLWDYLKQENYGIIELECATIYKKRNAHNEVG